jgi:imidazolonepropionase
VPDWLITGCSQLLTLRGPVPRRGQALTELGIISDGALLTHDDRIVAIGARRGIERLPKARRAEKLDLGGRVVLPGFVDSHTHLIFPESRAAEYEQRNSGATYEEIARSGGGIRSSVKGLRAASSSVLKTRALKNLREFAAHGTTTI